MSTGVSWWFDLLGIQSNFIVCCFNSGIQTCWELERPRGHMDLFDIQHRNSLLGHTSNIIQHYPLHHDRSFLCMICKYIYIYTPYHDIMRVYMCTNIYIYTYIYICARSIQFDPPAGPFTPNCHSPPDVAISKVAAPSGKSDPPWSTPGASHAAQVRQSVLYHYHQQGQHGPFMVQFLFISSMMCWSWKGWFMIFCHPFLKDIWIQLKFLVSKLTYLYLGTTKKRRNLSTLGSGCKKKVPLYVAPWRCRNVVLRS